MQALLQLELSTVLKPHLAEKIKSLDPTSEDYKKMLLSNEEAIALQVALNKLNKPDFAEKLNYENPNAIATQFKQGLKLHFGSVSRKLQTLLNELTQIAFLPEDDFSRMYGILEQGNYMSCGTHAELPHDLPKGLVACHAYDVINCYYYGHTAAIQISNPWMTGGVPDSANFEDLYGPKSKYSAVPYSEADSIAEKHSSTFEITYQDFKRAFPNIGFTNYSNTIKKAEASFSHLFNEITTREINYKEVHDEHKKKLPP